MVFRYLDNFAGSPYGFIIGFFTITSFIIYELKYQPLISYFTLITILSLSIIFGYRTIDTGTDTSTYYSWYEFLGSPNSTREFEWLFENIGYTFKTFDIDARFFLFSIAFISCLMLTKAYGKENKSLSGLALCATFSFIPGMDLLINGVRNGLALAIASYAAIKFFQDYKKINFLILVGIATLIHSSAIMFIVALCMPSLSRRFYLIPLYVFIVCFFMEIVGTFDALFRLLASAGIGGHYISRLLAFKYQESDMFSGILKYYFFVISLIPAGLYLLNKKINTQLLCFYYTISIPYSLIFSSPSSYRFSFLGYFIVIAIIMDYINKASFLNRQMMYVFLLIMFIITYTTNSAANYTFSLI